MPSFEVQPLDCLEMPEPISFNRTDISNFVVPWDDFKFLLLKHFNFSGYSMSKFHDYIYEWKEYRLFDCPNWEKLDDIDIFDQVHWKNKFEGDLYVVTDPSYRKVLGPFKINGFVLRKFVNEHQKIFGEHFFETDVEIISFEKKLFWLFHHNGASATVDLSDVDFC